MSFTFSIFYPKPNKYKPTLYDLTQYPDDVNRCDLEMYKGPFEVLASSNGLHEAVKIAFSYELPLALSPDHIWLSILQIFSDYVNSHAEELRTKFVNFDGKKTIEIRRDNFVLGSKDNDWSGVFKEFSEGIKANTAGIYDVVVANFSTTGPIERAATEIVFMDSMQKYFDYQMRTCCGIPRITLNGDPLDWLILRKKAEELGKFGLNWWMKDLLPVLDEFYFASQGQPNVEWWKSFYNYRGGSGISEMTGHLRVFFPKNGQVLQKVDVETDLPLGWSSVPVLWKYYAQDIPMRFLAGLKYTVFDEKGNVTPALFWAVGKDKVSSSK